MTDRPLIYPGSRRPTHPRTRFLEPARWSSAVYAEAKVTTNGYHWPFLGEIRKRKCLIMNWLPPRDSNPDMLIQSQSYGNPEFPGFCLNNQLLTSRISPHGSALAKERKGSIWRIVDRSARHTLRHTSIKRLHCLFADFRSALLRGSLSRVSEMSIEVYWHLRVFGDRARIAFAELLCQAVRDSKATGLAKFVPSAWLTRSLDDRLTHVVPANRLNMYVGVDVPAWLL